MGGYHIIDFAGITFTSGTEKTVNGVYEELEASNKLQIVHGLTVGSTEYDDFAIVFGVSDTSFIGKVTVNTATVTITVADDDGITVTVS